GVPEADGSRRAILSEGAVPANEPGLVAGGARHVLHQPGSLRLGVFAYRRYGQASCLWSLLRLLVRLHLAGVAGCRPGEDLLQLVHLLLVVAAGLIRPQGLLRLPQAQEDGLPFGIEAEAQAFEALLLSRSGEDRLGDHLRLLSFLRVDRRFGESRVHQLHLHTRPNMTALLGSRDG